MIHSFSESIVGKTGLDDIMLQSLLLERVKFIELLFVNGFMMRNFLTIEKLKFLYNESVSWGCDLDKLSKFPFADHAKGTGFHFCERIYIVGSRGASQLGGTF